MKSYTDLDQSRKLAEILPIESADMCYRIVAYNPNDTHEYQPYCFIGTLGSDIPCWSFAALLNAMPTCIDRYDLTIIHCSPIEWGCVYQDINGNTKYECYMDNQVDACVEMIYELKERNLL